MKKYFLYLMAVAFMLSCKKDDSPDPEIPKEKEVEVESTENKLLQLQGPQFAEMTKTWFIFKAWPLIILFGKC